MRSSPRADLVNDGVSKAEHYNPVHSTDNSLQAWRVVRAIIPDREDAAARKSRTAPAGLRNKKLLFAT